MTDEERALIRRLALLERGFTPIPLYGKRPLLSGWPTINADEATVRSWGRERPNETNTGLLTKNTPDDRRRHRRPRSGLRSRSH